jgi:hypothetical protein
VQELHSIYHLYWPDPTVIGEGWSIATTLKLLCKGKGEPAILKNYLGIAPRLFYAAHVRNNEVTIGKQLRPDLHRQPGVLQVHQGLKSVTM